MLRPSLTNVTIYWPCTRIRLPLRRDTTACMLLEVLSSSCYGKLVAKYERLLEALGSYYVALSSGELASLCLFTFILRLLASWHDVRSFVFRVILNRLDVMLTEPVPA